MTIAVAGDWKGDVAPSMTRVVPDEARLYVVPPTTSADEPGKMEVVPHHGEDGAIGIC